MPDEVRIIEAARQQLKRLRQSLRLKPQESLQVAHCRLRLIGNHVVHGRLPGKNRIAGRQFLRAGKPIVGARLIRERIAGSRQTGPIDRRIAIHGDRGAELLFRYHLLRRIAGQQQNLAQLEMRIRVRRIDCHGMSNRLHVEGIA